MVLLGSAWGAALAAWVVAGVALLPGARGEPACPAASGVEASISASMRRNATGHLLVSVDVEQQLRGSHRREHPPPLNIEALPAIRRCGDTITHAMRINLIGSPTLINADYEYVPGAGYYRVHEEKVSWIDAKDICEKENGGLLVINSQKEAKIIEDLIKKYSELTPWIYVGFYDAGKENWKTIYGETLKSAGYDHWRTAEKHGSGEIFGCISHNLDLGSCIISSASFICELNI